MTGRGCGRCEGGGRRLCVRLVVGLLDSRGIGESRV